MGPYNQKSLRTSKIPLPIFALAKAILIQIKKEKAPEK
jgi:hypothetical protein